jgi:transposase
VWLCKLNERGMLRRSFVSPPEVRDLRALTRTRARLAKDQARHQNRVEKILEDALLKVSVVISDLFGASGRRFLDALVGGQRCPKALAALGDKRLKATRQELEAAQTGRFRDIHALEIGAHLRLIDAINEEIARLDQAIVQQLAAIPGTAPACVACGLVGGGHVPGCTSGDIPLLDLAGRLDEITRVGERNAQVIIAELGTDPSQFPAPGHAAACARLTPRTMRSGETVRPGRTGKGNRYLRGALGQAAMATARTDTRLGAMYRRTARRRGKQKAIVAVSRVISSDRLDPHLRPRRPLPRAGPRLLQPPQPRPPDPGQDPRARTPQPRQESHLRRHQPRSQRRLKHHTHRSRPITRYGPECHTANRNHRTSRAPLAPIPPGATHCCPPSHGKSRTPPTDVARGRVGRTRR